MRNYTQQKNRIVQCLWIAAIATALATPAKPMPAAFSESAQLDNHQEHMRSWCRQGNAQLDLFLNFFI
ncbi:hypothetical protein AOLI_G00016590 [Acnodon oligacanthus]